LLSAFSSLVFDLVSVVSLGTRICVCVCVSIWGRYYRCVLLWWWFWGNFVVVVVVIINDFACSDFLILVLVVVVFRLLFRPLAGTRLPHAKQ